MLTELAGSCGEVAQKIQERTGLRQTRVADFNAEVKEFGVRLSVEPRIKTANYRELTKRYRQGAEALGQLPAPEAPLLHTRLQAAYERLQQDLVAGDHLLFAYAEFGHFLEVFEEDDLKIEFNVTGHAESFRPIDQLSAGQRCTAVFPLLLKLREGPLIVDQPEDNLDNRHIASFIAPALMEDKKSRQVLLTSHNANLVVLSDSESITVFESTGSEGHIEEQGFLATKSSAITKYVLEILDGGEKALEQRYLKYGKGSIG